MLNELEVELPGHFAAEHSTVVLKVKLKVVRNTESLSMHALGHQRVDIVVVSGMVSKEAWIGWLCTLRGNLKLENHSFCLSSGWPNKCLLAMGS